MEFFHNKECKTEPWWKKWLTQINILGTGRKQNSIQNSSPWKVKDNWIIEKGTWNNFILHITMFWFFTQGAFFICLPLSVCISNLSFFAGLLPVQLHLRHHFVNRNETAELKHLFKSDYSQVLLVGQSDYSQVLLVGQSPLDIYLCFVAASYSTAKSTI